MSVVANDVYLAYNETLATPDIVDTLAASLFAAAEDLYALGARAYVFNLVLPYDRARYGIDLSLTARALLKRTIDDFNSSIRKGVLSFCGKYTPNVFCAVVDTCTLNHV